MKYLALISVLFLTACPSLKEMKQKVERKPRLSMFVGVDVSGSFLRSQHYENALEFLAHYIYGHINGLGEMEVPAVLFVGEIGGSDVGEPKTLFPIHTFQGKSISEIHRQLKDIFPRKREDAITDFNVFFKQIQTYIRTRKLALRPISIVLLSDGIPDHGESGEPNQDFDYRRVDLSSLERLSRTITIRLLYTSPKVGLKWQTEVPRKRVRLWTQDAVVMSQWKAPNIYSANKPFAEQRQFFDWVRENVNFGVRAVRVD